MHLVKLDSETLAVVEVLPMVNAPYLQPLDSTYLIAVNPPPLGQLFDPETKAFVVPPRKRWVTKLAFDSRFTMAEAVALKLGQSMPAHDDPAFTSKATTAASLQVLQSRLNMATYIDLDRDDTRSAVQSLEAMGLLGAGRALEILDGPIATPEYYKDA